MEPEFLKDYATAVWSPRLGEEDYTILDSYTDRVFYYATTLEGLDQVEVNGRVCYGSMKVGQGREAYQANFALSTSTHDALRERAYNYQNGFLADYSSTLRGGPVPLVIVGLLFEKGYMKGMQERGLIRDFSRHYTGEHYYFPVHAWFEAGFTSYQKPYAGGGINLAEKGLVIEGSNPRILYMYWTLDFAGTKAMSDAMVANEYIFRVYQAMPNMAMTKLSDATVKAFIAEPKFTEIDYCSWLGYYLSKVEVGIHLIVAATSGRKTYERILKEQFVKLLKQTNNKDKQETILEVLGNTLETFKDTPTERVQAIVTIRGMSWILISWDKRLKHGMHAYQTVDEQTIPITVEWKESNPNCQEYCLDSLKRMKAVAEANMNSLSTSTTFGYARLHVMDGMLDASMRTAYAQINASTRSTLCQAIIFLQIPNWHLARSTTPKLKLATSLAAYLKSKCWRIYYTTAFSNLLVVLELARLQKISEVEKATELERLNFIELQDPSSFTDLRPEEETYLMKFMNKSTSVDSSDESLSGARTTRAATSSYPAKAPPPVYRHSEFQAMRAAAGDNW